MVFRKIVTICFLVLPILSNAQYLTGELHHQIDNTKEYRVCGKPLRESDGTIARSTSVIAAYRKLYPCPATGKTTGPCKGWAINHMIPLAKGGCDSVINMAWLPVEVKSCSKDYCVDRWERVYYGQPFGVVPRIEGK